MPSFIPELHVTARSKEIEQTLKDNREAILADLESLELTIRDLAAKYKVNDRNIRRFAEREKIDLADRQARRRTSGHEARGRPIKTKPKREDNVRNPTLLSARW